MGNRVYALEWLQFAYRNLITAKHLLDVNHFTDIIVVDAQQAIEKTLKSILAYENKKITKTHNLDELASLITDKMVFADNEISVQGTLMGYNHQEMEGFRCII